jgi:hypothetical protein
MLASGFRKPFLLSMLLLPAAWGQPIVDLGVVGRIKTEAYDHSKVMDHLSWLSDVYGPRLTASPEFFQAADWAAGRLREIGLSNVHLETWDRLAGRGRPSSGRWKWWSRATRY